jgi:hypothetical protein
MNTDHNSSQVQSIVAGWPDSGMTQVEYAKSNDITIHTLRYWLYNRKKKSVSSPAFIELKNIFKGSGILLRYPNGVELQVPAGSSLQTLKALISL